MTALLLPVFDKYTPYIWVCFGVTALVLIGLLLASIRMNSQTFAELEQLDAERRDGRETSQT